MLCEECEGSLSARARRAQMPTEQHWRLGAGEEGIWPSESRKWRKEAEGVDKREPDLVSPLSTDTQKRVPEFPACSPFFVSTLCMSHKQTNQPTHILFRCECIGRQGWGGVGRGKGSDIGGKRFEIFKLSCCL